MAQTTPPASQATPLTRIEMPSSDDVFGGTRSIHSAYVFSVDKQIGEGTYGQVFMGHDRKTNDKVALKKIRMDTEKEGFPITAIREIKILSSLSHPNVVNLREIVRSEIHKNNNFKGSIYMVFDYAEYDLTGLMESQKYNFIETQVKCILKQLLKGLAYCHSNGVLHRDLKASNILIDMRGTVKLADFGLARPFNAENEAGFTNRVITLWYRPPELLLGAVKYGGEVDMWSVGCIFAELLTGKPLFPGKDDLDQMDKIFQIMGAPTEHTWPGVTTLGLKNYKNVVLDKYNRQHRLRETIRQKAGGKQIGEGAVLLLEKMLCLDPKRRISAADAVMDPYLWTDPMPCEPQQLPCRGSGHEFTMKKRRNDQHAGAGAGQHREAVAGPAMPLPGVPGGPPYAAAQHAGAHYGPGGQGGPDPKRQRFAGPGQTGPTGFPASGARPPGGPSYGGAGAGGSYSGGAGGYQRQGAMGGGGYMGGQPGAQGAQQGYSQRPGGGGPMGPPQAMGGGHHPMGGGAFPGGGAGGPQGYRGPGAGGPPGQGQGRPGQPPAWQQPKR